MPGAGILYIPTAASPFKPDGQTPGSDRLEMVRRAIDRGTREAIWSDEVDRGGVSFTIDTLRRATAAAPGTRFRLMLGADQAVSFHTWREPREILKLATPLVLLRAPVDSRQELAARMASTGCWTEQEIATWASLTIEAPLLTISSSKIRAMVREGGVARVPEEWLSRSVREWIEARGLYRGGSAP
jgi:nicotinate-nucleotide adenylyltransferase